MPRIVLRNAATAALIAAVLMAGGFVTSRSWAEPPADQAPPQAAWPTTGWETSTPEGQGMDSASLARLVEAVGTYRQDSLTIIRNGWIVADAYYAPYGPGIRHDLRSVTKSIVSTLTAIELQRGLLDSVDHPVLDLFSDKQIANVDDNKRAMTVQNLLDMTSGIAWQEQAYTPDEPLLRMYRSPNPTEFVLRQPMSGTPGKSFYYNSGNPYLLSALISRKTGHNALEFARSELFRPLGIEDVRWGAPDAQNVTDGEAGLYLAPHDMAKIGYLYLRNGMWDGRQLIPPSWVDRAKAGQVPAAAGFHYANLWWSLPEKGAYMALGRHSQMIVVIPKLNIVAVMTGILPDGEIYPATRVVDDIAAAVKSDQPLPADSVAQSLLAASIRAAAAERTSATGETPELAETISGKSYRFADNELRMKTFSLNLTGPDPGWEITTTTGKPEQPTERFFGPLGLDGTFRKGPTRAYGIDAVRGRWLNRHTFAVERRVLGHGETQLWVLDFDGNKVVVNFSDTDGSRLELHGETRTSF
jgi:CubicO group peptidase (beta-lactamase class C family)